MEAPKAETAELFLGLRPNSRRPTPAPWTTREKPKRLSAPDHVYGKATPAASSVESIKSDIMSKMATLEASLVAQIHESRSREEKLRNKLAKSRVAKKDLQAKLSRYDHDRAEGQTIVVEKPPELPMSSRASWSPPMLSCCGDLRQLARNQVIRIVQDLSPEFTVDLEVHSYGGYIPWSKVLDWLEDHPDIVKTIGLNFHALRTI
ncbi:hypothetical protein MPTK1_5g07310 [Marchantia polymorpha subsp. ruderalis]|uniref:Uncharacterized protein n=2 Tax=Marchantia polymorpha TaxID=3197 RepID=A0A176WQ50_MARPO|nr:hypothetical protein AXG93_1162s1240 [Marchantia polymorpha subsp. ruderalis]PTQ30275.1 hypothetical protein MARPO_0127s0055 [Marchantia polymorpha]BBN10891.1 hypothetical protein Mp_5g07310 [Marchantia polymorpha subsp. ruderalis]|eukprot:PTQ30275.1 hypothetical protein MARPO_0127s0055 [Marchantia polymorpha]